MTAWGAYPKRMLKIMKESKSIDKLKGEIMSEEEMAKILLDEKQIEIDKARNLIANLIIEKGDK